MGSVKVTVYGRIKPCLKSPQEYKVKYGDEEDQITFIASRVPSRRSFRFKKIFGEDATQDQVFETVAKPVIKNIFSGYNGTIFTYGQTGSGKTYTMTGDIEEWADPGLIPRVIQEIFNLKSVETIITITFCEIYNEHIYDLVRADNCDSEATALSIVTDSNSGITNFRNLSNHRVKSAEEAIQLFVRGDSNKMVAETGSNFRSSRSHAIFSIGLDFQHPTQENLRLKPVLYLVDLAGSEKLSKCKTPMSNVSETRYINLSLHYLEQVLIALRQPGRAHIPYRNSLMTALLRNSLGGNSITIMIATFSVSKEDAEETIQTCRFAERIALIKNDVKLIELSNPEKEIDYLKKENERLRAQLKLVCNEQILDQLDDKEKEKCIEAVRNFIQDNDYFELPLTNIRRMEYCFRIMRDEILKEKEFNECKDVKSRESQLECLRRIRSVRSLKSVKSLNYIRSDKPFKLFDNDESHTKLAKIKTEIHSSKSLVKKSSGEIPKVNIIFDEDRKGKPDSRGKENEAPKNNRDVNTNKVKFLSAINKKDEKLNNSSQMSNSALEFFLKKKSYSSFTEVNKEKEKTKESEINAQTACKFDLLIQKKEESPTLPPKRIISSLFNDDETVDEKGQTGDERNSEQISHVPSSTDFMSFTSKCVPLTGDKEVDEEIIKFYKTRYQIFKNK